MEIVSRRPQLVLSHYLVLHALIGQPLNVLSDVGRLGCDRIRSAAGVDQDTVFT